jgi:hypothetical protein
MTDRDLMKQALDAMLTVTDYDALHAAKIALRKRLAQPEQEPVVFYRCKGCGHAYENSHPTSCDCMEAKGFDRVDYYTSPPAAQQEPVAEVKLKTTGGNVGIATVIHEIYSHYREPLRVGDKLYTTPPAAQRQWVGLTVEEIIDVIHPLVMADMPDEATDYEIARAIEAKLKEKNT